MIWQPSPMPATPQEMVITHIKLKGELTWDNSMELRSLLTNFMRIGHPHIILDMTEVTHCHSAFFTEMMDRTFRLRQYGGDLKIGGFSNMFRWLTRLYYAEDLFDFCQSPELAEYRFRICAGYGD